MLVSQYRGLICKQLKLQVSIKMFIGRLHHYNKEIQMLTIQGYFIDSIFAHADGFSCVVAGTGIGLIARRDSPDYDLVQAYLLNHPDALCPEPIPPPPNPEQLEAQAEAQRQACFTVYDKAILMLTRAERLGDVTASDKIKAWDAYAVALQKLNDVPDWYINTVWPEVPL